MLSVTLGIIAFIQTGFAYTIVVEGIYPMIKLPWLAASLQLVIGIGSGTICFFISQLFQQNTKEVSGEKCEL